MRLSARTGQAPPPFRWIRPTVRSSISSPIPSPVSRAVLAWRAAAIVPALREFEAALKENPNRYRGLYGAARAAEGAGNQEKATAFFAKLVTLSKNADTDRPELARATAFLAKK